MAGLAAILAPSFLPAQITFQRTYGGSWDDEGNSAQQTADGGYVIAGWTESFGAGYCDVYLIKTDARGDTLWTKAYGGLDDDWGTSVQQVTDGGYIIAGCTWSFGAGRDDVYLVKTDADGDTLWTRTFGGTSGDWSSSVQQTTDSGYIIAGATYSFGAGSEDVYLVKTDSVGDTLWTRAYGGAGEEHGWSVRQTADGGYVIAGRTESFGAGDYDVYLIKTDAYGDTLWTRTYGGMLLEESWSVRQTTDSGYIISGYTNSFGAGGCDVYLVKTDAHGDTKWTRTYGGTGNDYGWSVQQTSDSGYIIAGYTTSFGAGAKDVHLIKTDGCGDTLWTRTYGGRDGDYGYSVQRTSDGGYVIAGKTGSFGAGAWDVYLIKTDSLGNVAVAEPKASPTRAPALSLSCEPNPSRGSVTISLSPSIPLSLSPVLRIFDAQGRLVLSYPVRTSSFILHASSLPSGVYLARLDAAGRHASARIVLLQ
jgi:hypothetical protein